MAIFGDIAAEVSLGGTGETEPRRTLLVISRLFNTHICWQLTAVFQQVGIYVFPMLASALPAASFFPPRGAAKQLAAI